MVDETAMDKTLQMYANPAMIQTTALDKLSAQVLGGEPVVDGNNVFTFLNEFNAQCTAGFATAVSKKFESLYPSRAQTFEDLYGHMSDWDFEGLYAYPSTTKIQIAFDRNFLIDNAKPVEGEADYRKIVLPEFSTFTIGEYKFGIHYPIEIQIRMVYKQDTEGNSTAEIDYDACNITTQWDLSTVNPLCSYDTNILEHRNYVSGGLTLVCIEVPVYQFVINTQIDDAIANTGYLQKFDYEDKFYVLRVYHKQDGDWQELAQSYSSIVYDPDTVTALVKVFPDLNQVTVEIPQVYFDKGMVGSQIRIDIYTTKGAMNVDISSYTRDQFSASFLFSDDRTSDSTYSDMLKYINTCIVAAINTKITNGNDGISLAELKRRVVDRTEKNLLITPEKITSYLSGRGFTARNYVDNITNRCYMAEKVLTDNDNTIISAGSFNTCFSSTDVKTATDTDTGKQYFVNHDTFRYINDSAFVVLPNTIYKYDETMDTCTPMDNKFVNNLNRMGIDEKITLLNSGIYSFSPFHLKVSITNDVPVAAYYDLLAPKVKNINFPADGENRATSTQISMYNHSIQHLNDGIGSYVFDILLYKTEDIEKVPVIEEEGLKENIKVMLRFANEDGIYSYMYGKYMGESEKHDWMRFELETDYVIDANNRLEFTCFTSSGQGVRVDLTQEFEVLFFISKEVFTGEIGKYPNDIPADIRQNYVWLATQNITLTFGEKIDALMTTVYTQAEDSNPRRYPTTVFATYPSDMYYRWTMADVAAGAKDWRDNPITEDMVGTYKFDPEIQPNGLTITHKQGDVIISSTKEELVPLSFMVTTTSAGVSSHEMYALTNKYTQTSKDTNEFAAVEYRVPTSTDLGGYYVDTVSEVEDPTESKRHQITQKIIDEGKYLYIEKRDPVITREVTDALYFMLNIGKNNTVDDKMAMYSVITSAPNGDQSIENLIRKEHFIICNSVSEDDPDKAEFKPTADWWTTDLGTGKALYRVDPTIDIHSYGNFTHTRDGREVAFNLTTLQELWNDVDSFETEALVRAKWGLETTELTLLKKIRFPFIKVVEFSSSDLLDDYIHSEANTGHNGYIERYCETTRSGGVSSKKTIFYRYLTHDENDNLLLDTVTCEWDMVDKWPWELNDGKLVRWSTALYAENIFVSMNEKTSVIVSHAEGSVITDEGVNSDTYSVPVEDGDETGRKIAYNINMLHLDYKLLYSQEVAHQNYRTSTVETIRSYFTTINETRLRLLEGTTLYYSPIRTMGYAKFKGKNGDALYCDLNISLGFRLHAETFISANQSTKTTIRANALNIVDKHIASGTVSVVDIASELQKAMSDTILHVDVLGINDNQSLQTLLRADTSSIPHLGYRLVKNDNGSIGVERSLTLEYSVIR